MELDRPASQALFAQVIGVSQQAVSDMKARNVLPDHGTLHGWLLAYISHLREQAAGRAAAHELGLTAARTEQAREAAERIRLQNAVTRRELVPASLVEEVLAKAAAQVSGIFEGIPGAIRRRLPELPATALALVEEEIARARNVVATMTLSDVMPAPPAPGDPPEDGDADDDTNEEGPTDDDPPPAGPIG